MSIARARLGLEGLLRRRQAQATVAPTHGLLPMADDDSKIVMHMVSRETLFWETMEKLKALGASSILVLPIEKMLK